MVISAFNFVRAGFSGMRPRFSLDFLVSLIGLPFCVAVFWYFDQVDNLSVRITVTVLYAAIPLASLFTTPSVGPPWRRLNIATVVVAVLFIAIFLLLWSAEASHTALTYAIVILLVTSPLLYAFAVIFRRPLVALAVVPAMAIGLVYLIVSALPEGERLDHFLFPLPLVLVVSLPWAALAWLCVWFAERRRKVVIWGPATEAVAMLVLFLPTITLSIVVPMDLFEDNIWQAVPVTIVGVLFSSIVSVPLRQFLLDVGNLPPNGRWEG